MALSPSQVWEVRTTGVDTNGGAFKAGAAGTDYSVQDVAQVAVADAVANGTTTLTSATATFSAAHVGNVVYLVGGSGSLAAARREIVTFTNSTTVVLDAVVATGTGITLNLGGALLTFGELANATRGMVASNKAFVKSGTYGITTGVTFAQTVGSPGFSATPSEIVGYKTTRGDIAFGVNAANRPLINTNASISALTFTGQGWSIRNLQFGAGTTTPFRGMLVTGNVSVVANCLVTSYSSSGFNTNAQLVGFHQCEATGGVAGALGGIVNGFNNGSIVGCYVHDGAGVGIQADGSITHNVIANQSGTTADGIAATAYNAVLYNTVYNCGRHGISYTGMAPSTATVKGNILAKNGGYGLTNLGGAGLPARREWDGNAYYNNTSSATPGGPRNNLDDTTVNPTNGIAPYTNVLDVLLASPNDPFTNAAGGDFSLNNTAGRGALLRGTGPLNAWPGLTQVGYRDFGAIQHQDAGGTTITTFIEG